jgi:hypothetical protein
VCVSRPARSVSGPFNARRAEWVSVPVSVFVSVSLVCAPLVARCRARATQLVAPSCTCNVWVHLYQVCAIRMNSRWHQHIEKLFFREHILQQLNNHSNTQSSGRREGSDDAQGLSGFN